MTIFATLDPILSGTGLFVRGAFHPTPDDGVPALADGSPAASAVLIGNAGNALWDAFRRAVPEPAGADPLDRWIDGHLERAARAVGATLVYATRKPWPPILRWARRCEPVHASPLGLLIHPDYGLWHVYRGALLFAERIALAPAPPTEPSPCDSCADRPCLSTCPVGAFQPGSFDPAACVDHVESPAGRACAGGGCLARRACPVGRGFAYGRDPGAFHMAAVVRSVRQRQAPRALVPPPPRP
jgi:hypothetical protein